LGPTRKQAKVNFFSAEKRGRKEVKKIKKKKTWVTQEKMRDVFSLEGPADEDRQMEIKRRRQGGRLSSTKSKRRGKAELSKNNHQKMELTALTRKKTRKKTSGAPKFE